MALVRILVDGYSLLHSWPELAPGKPRHSAAARDELIRVLTLYQEGLQQVLNGNTSLEEISCLSYTSVDADWDKEVADPDGVPTV